MNKQIVILLMLVNLASFALAASSSTSIGVIVTPGNSAPQIWQNTAQRQLQDTFGNPLTRTNNYAFTGEKIKWSILVRDSNGREDISTMTVNVGPNPTGNPKQVSCTIASVQPSGVITWANGITFDATTDVLYDCLLTVEPGFLGEYWTQAVVVDDSGISAQVRENSFFWFNPSIGLQILDADSGLIFTESGKASGIVTPGAIGYSQTARLKSIVASGSGVILDIDIKGSDFYDPASIGARCPTTNQLALSNFRYYATKGSYSTRSSATADTEGYDVIGYNYANIIKNAGNEASRLSEGSEFALTFKLNLPRPCIGSYSSGNGFQFEATAL